jgi:hypothetical protein
VCYSSLASGVGSFTGDFVAVTTKPTPSLFLHTQNYVTVEMARRAGMRAIGVLGPFPTEKRLRAACPDFLIGSLGELPGVMKRLLR